MRPLRRTLATAVFIPGALALTACGSLHATGSAGSSAAATVAVVTNAHLTQAQLLVRLKAALTDVTALHMKGTMSDSGSTVTMDMQINKDGSSQGSIDTNGMSMPMLVTGGASYLQITPSYIKTITGGMSADELKAAGLSKLKTGDWMKFSDTSTDSPTSDMNGFLNFNDMIQQLSQAKGEKFSYLGTSTLEGQQVAQYKDVTTDKSSPDAVMSVPLSGPFLPIELNAGSQGTMTFVWNEPTKVVAPPASEIVTLPSM